MRACTSRPSRAVLSQITVSDTGPGMSPEIQSRIFEPFFTTKDMTKGTGLGLSTALTIVKSHGGFINVYSELHKGTQFALYLPALDAPETAEAGALQTDLPLGNGELILVVDDEESIREITCGTLETFGYRVLKASDGTEATGAIRRAPKRNRGCFDRHVNAVHGWPNNDPRAAKE